MNLYTLGANLTHVADRIPFKERIDNKPVNFIPDSGKLTFNMYLLYDSVENINNNKHDMVFQPLLKNIKVPIPIQPYNNFFLGVAPIYNKEHEYITWNKWNGGMRNFLIIDDILNLTQIKNLFYAGSPERYIWNYSGEISDIDNVINEKLLSIININNSSLIDLIYCKTAQNVTNISPEVFQ